ncbi:MAG TPA: FAD-binding oxidoreductase [Candidatus Xenobia bacterium]|nr:FAD-binding oxidoreductase [Candidatus Xenobia bacterium]
MPVATASLEHLLGAQHVRTDAEALQRFRVDGLAPSAVVEPASSNELVEIVRWARANKSALLPVTSGNFLPIGNPPEALDVAVSLARLNRVVAYDPKDLTVSVEAGVRLGEVQRRLAEHNQFLPADPLFAEEAAMGGLIATNASGPLRCAYGTWRDFTIGMKFVTGEGKLVQSGGRVVKNVAGYDLARLLIGSLGTLGIITEVGFKCFPLPARRGTFLVSFPDARAALAFRDAVIQSPLQPMALELLDPAAARLLDSALVSREHWSLVIAATGVDNVIQRHQRDLDQLARKLTASSFVAHTQEHPASLWEAVRELISTARAIHPRTTIIKVGLPLASMAPFYEKALAVAARYELPAAASGHAGSGIAYIYLLEDAPKKAAQAATEMIHAGNNLGGRVTIPWCPTEVKHDVNVWGPLRDDFSLMQKLKAAFDPDRILNAGRFLGGL